MNPQNLFLQQIAEVSIVYRSKVKPSDRLQIKCSKDAHEILLNCWNHETIEHCEEFKLILLNRANKVLGIASLSKGGISGTVTDVRLVLQYAIKTNASGIIVAHNHPSGSLNPSESDSRITQKLKEAGIIMDIQLLDHLILAPEDAYYSFADNGLL